MEVGLLGCPNEVLELICVFLCGHCVYDRNDEDGTDALLDLCLASKHLRGIAQPVLFHKFSSYKPLNKQALLFLRSLVHRPDLRPAVREVGFGLGFSGLFSPPSPEDLRNILTTAISEEPSLNLAAVWETEHVAKSIFGTMLSYTSNLTALRSTALPWLRACPPTLPRLRKLYLDNEATDLKDIVHFLQHAPNLGTLIVYGLGCSHHSNVDYQQILGDDLAHRLGNIRRLILPRCTIHPVVLASIISSCGPLESFFLSVSHVDEHEFSYGLSLSTTALEPWEALLEKRQDLSSLTILMSRGYGFRPSSNEHPSFLRDLESLEELEIDSEVTKALADHWRGHRNHDSRSFLAQILPESIRRLALVNATADLIEPARGLSDAVKSGRFPKFGVLVLKPQLGEAWPHRSAWIKRISELRSLFADVDVSVMIENLTLSEGWEHAY